MWRQANQIDWGISEARLGEIAAPTHIVWGRQDTATPPEDAARMMACIPGATLRVIDDCGHYPPIERPDAFAPEVLTMIQRLAGASAG
jgi:pimeloyl-ACP methyl ester carboxylesterase